MAPHIPLTFTSNITSVWDFLVFLFIGIGFGASLEMSGFGDSRKLASQFYFRDMTVLKVMFTAIIVAATLLTFFSSMEWLDFSKIWVNHSYIMPGIIGGFIMGIGFIIGGFCPGTSLVSASTLKIDGLFFILGVTFGIGLFGETISHFENFWNSTYLGRLTLFDYFKISQGLILFLVLLLAFVMFYGGEILEQIFGENKKFKNINFIPKNKFKMGGALTLVLLSFVTLLKGFPTPSTRFHWISEIENQKITNRDIFIDPREVLEVMDNSMLATKIFDIRSETSFNIFHIKSAKRMTTKDLTDQGFISNLLRFPSNTVIFLVGNDENTAVDWYRILRGQGVNNLYIIENGLNNWLTMFPPDLNIAKKLPSSPPLENCIEEKLNFSFFYAVGDGIESAAPTLSHDSHESYTKKVKVVTKKAKSGGCG